MSREDVIAIRKATGLNKSQFARLIGVNYRTILRWERGDYEPSGLALVALNKAKEAKDVSNSASAAI